MSDANRPACHSASNPCPSRTSLLCILGTADEEPLSARSNAHVARLLGAYSDAESAARASRSTALLLLRELSTPPPGSGAPSPGRRLQRRAPRTEHSRPQRARSALHRRADPTRGVRAARVHRYGLRQLRCFFRRQDRQR